VPDVVGLTETDAKRRTRAASLRPEIDRESSVKVPAGIVIRSDPSAGRPVDRRSAVTLVVSSGPEQVQVPEVTGFDEEQAVAALRAKGLSAVVRERESSEPEGTVVSQSPLGGQEVDQGSTVTVFVSNGRVKEVPDVTGLAQSEAESQIEDAGFVPSVRNRPTDQPDEEGIVLSQAPRGGVQRRENSTVTLTVGELTTTPAPEAPAAP
jgi:beta-lactam-binding protein with PASTA domain